MSFELLIFTKDWLFGPDNNGKRYEGLIKVINKGYSKNFFKYNIIITDRITNSFISDIGFEPDQDVFFLLLGPKTVFDKLKNEHGLIRDFDKPTTSAKESYSCHIPKQFEDLFIIDDKTEIDVSIVKPDLVINDDILYRTLATAGLKSFTGESEYKDDPMAKEYQLTTVTSFLNGLGPKFLDIIIDKFLTNRASSIINHKGIDKFIIHSEVVREHGLVEYYTKYCGFKRVEKFPDFHVKVNPDGTTLNSPFMDVNLANSDFHLSYLYRVIDASYKV